MKKSQEELSRLCELPSAAYYSDVEVGRRPPPKYDVLLRMAKRMNLSLALVFEAAAYSLRYLKEVRGGNNDKTRDTIKEA